MRKAARVLAALCLCAVLCAACLPAAGEAQRITLSFAGDCTLGSSPQSHGYARSFVGVVNALGFAHPFSGVRDIFAADDFTLVNLEGTFTDARKAAEKSFVFRAPPAFAQILPLGSVEAVNIANNHIDDFLQKGREDTLAALDAQGVVYAGDGLLAWADVQGVRIGMTGYSYSHTRTLEYLADDIPALRAMGCDIIIVSMHAGTEENYSVTGTQKTVARGAIDLGADIVVGHHPHVVHGVEVYKGKPIFYSLGNFAFGGNINPKDWDTMIGQVIVERDGEDVRLAEMRIIPCLISEAERSSDFRPVPAQGERAGKIMQKLRRSSLGDIDPVLFETGALSLLP